MRIGWIGCFVALLATSCADDSALDLASDGGVGSDAAAPREAECTARIRLLDYKLDPAKLELSSGHHLLCAQNDGKAPHDLALRDTAKKVLGRTPVLGPDEHGQFAVDLEAGTYTMFCTQAGHESLGMTGPVTVE